jgi:hypothetical protein
MVKKLLILIVFVLVFAMYSTAWGYLYSGAISNRTDSSGTGALLDTEGGLSATGNSWAATGNNLTNRGVRLEWGIDYDASSGVWTYTYTCLLGTGVNKTARNFNIETASNFTAGDLVSWKVTDFDGNKMTDVAGPGTYAGTKMPAAQGSPFGLSLFGYDWYFPSGFASTNSTTIDYAHTVIFKTTRSPMWGDFLMVGDLTNEGYCGAWNSQFNDLANRPSGYGNGNNGGWVLVPGAAAAAPVPVPPAVFLLGSGLAGLGLFRRRKAWDEAV